MSKPQIAEWTFNLPAARKENTNETRLAQLQAPTAQLSPDEFTSALWVLHLLVIQPIFSPPATAQTDPTLGIQLGRLPKF